MFDSANTSITIYSCLRCLYSFNFLPYAFLCPDWFCCFQFCLLITDTPSLPGSTASMQRTTTSEEAGCWNCFNVWRRKLSTQPHLWAVLQVVYYCITVSISKVFRRSLRILELSWGLSDRLTSMYSELANDLQQRAPSSTLIFLWIRSYYPYYSKHVYCTNRRGTLES